MNKSQWYGPLNLSSKAFTPSQYCELRSVLLARSPEVPTCRACCHLAITTNCVAHLSSLSTGAGVVEAICGLYSPRN